MCGRYASSRGVDDLVDVFEIDQVAVTETLAADYNVAPTKPVYAVLTRPVAKDDDVPVRQLRVLTWGLVPSWAKDPSVASRFINARVETVADKPAFRRAFAARRCLLPADGYFEWYGEKGDEEGGGEGPGKGPGKGPRKGRGKGRAPRQPYFIHPRDGGVLAMAGLYELWRDPTREADDPRRWRWTATVLTTEAEDALGRLHDRMPLLVPPERYTAWLDPAARDPRELRGLLVPAAPGRLDAYPVSTEVNNVQNNGPHLVEALPAPDPAADPAPEHAPASIAEPAPEPLAAGWEEPDAVTLF